MLYEMLTGKRAFEGEDATEVLARIIEREPDFKALPPTTPPAIRRLLRRSLEKDRKRRLPDIAGARIEIDDVGDERDLDGQPAATARKALGGRERVAWVVGILLAVGVTAAASIGMSYFRAPANALEMRLDIVTPGVPDSPAFAISPDGRRLVFVASGDGQSRLWLRPLDADAAQPLAGTEGARYPFWSPDSRSVGFFSDGKLKRIDIGSGAPRILANANLGYGGTWSPDGVILFSSGTASPLFRIPASGDPLKRALSGDPVLVADSVVSVGQTAAFAAAAFSASTTGLVGYRTGGVLTTGRPTAASCSTTPKIPRPDVICGSCRSREIVSHLCS